jgi:hypothetical protein
LIRAHLSIYKKINQSVSKAVRVTVFPFSAHGKKFLKCIVNINALRNH